ncbi:pumilio homolog 24 isoform X2 [Magnolia sinica]|uniref:pumilio homolog 24 isoform X2 n=1 Tax=Magnolia sinica TaxID=86752 RepID=UPI00265A04EF|nr:pumilio homolog 24 isoform X2 [Magnolia sinica]
MAAKEHQKQDKKRKRNLKEGEREKPTSKKTKHLQSKSPKPPSTNKASKKPIESSKKHKFKSPSEKSLAVREKNEPKSKKESRLLSKELAEVRKKKRKPHYTLQHELASLWEKMRRRNIAKEDRSKLISEALQKMTGKIPEIAGSHISSRVLQTCVKYCSQAERDCVFEELRPHLLSLARNTYAVHLVKKMLDNASKKQLEGFISSLHGHVASLLRHMVGSVVVEHAFQLGNGSQKQTLLLELYSTELQLFKDLTTTNEGRLVDLISKLGLQKSSVLQHMSLVIQPILEKGIVDHSIIHKALMEYFSIADKSSASDVIQQLSGPLLVRMIHTRDGSKVGMLCVKHGSAKERKKLIKGMKGHIGKIAHDQCGNMVLVCILSAVDDTKLITKVIVRELQAILKELVLDKGERLEVTNFEKQKEFSAIDSEHKDDENDVETLKLADGGKKDPSLRRFELLVNSGLAESLIDTCIESAGELLRSNFGKEVVYEVATGGAGGILHETLSDKIGTLHEAIATLASLPKAEKSDEHLFENFHSSRTIRKLVLDSPSFAATLWKSALEGKCDVWAEGHSCKVVSAFLESSDSMVRDLAKRELQPLIDRGVLKAPETKQAEKEG